MWMRALQGCREAVLHRRAGRWSGMLGQDAKALGGWQIRPINVADCCHSHSTPPTHGALQLALLWPTALHHGTGTMLQHQATVEWSNGCCPAACSVSMVTSWWVTLLWPYLIQRVSGTRAAFTTAGAAFGFTWRWTSPCQVFQTQVMLFLVPQGPFWSSLQSTEIFCPLELISLLH